jgi:F-type H+-transporting ATPase subunit b
MALPPLGQTLVAAGGLTDINWTLNVATLVLFLIFALVLGKFAWKPLLQLVEEREKGVRDAVEGAEKASAEAQALLERHKELIREAGRERDELMKRAAKEAEQLKADLSARARAESEQIVQKAREQIGREKTLAVQELRAQVADIAVEAAAKIVTSSLTPEAQKKLVAEFIADLPKAAR